jgi:hypothetical protein
MTTQRAQEQFVFSGGKVDRAGPYPIVRDALLCGATSRWKRRYGAGSFGHGKVYEGKLVFVDHADPKEKRKYADKLGWIENERRNEAGLPIGDIGVNPKHPLAEQFLFDAEHKPAACGLSHIADIETKAAADGWDDVTRVVEVDSVDIVIGPATTNGIFEQFHRSTPVFTFKNLPEWITRHPKSTTQQITRAKKIAEDMNGLGMGDIAVAPSEPAADADPDATVLAGLMAAGHAAWDACLSGKMEFAAMVAKLKDLAKDHGKYSEKGDEPAAKPKDEEQAPKPPTVGQLVAEAKGAGVKDLTGDDIAILSDLPTPEGRKRYHETLLARGGTAPSSPGRAPGAGAMPVQESAAQDAGKPPTEGKAFADWVQE